MRSTVLSIYLITITCALNTFRNVVPPARNASLSTTPLGPTIKVKATDTNLSTDPFIHPSFSIHTTILPTRLKATPLFLTAVHAARELALSDLNARQPEKDYHYTFSEDVTIYIRGWPTRTIGRNYAMWGLVLCVTSLTDMKVVNALLCKLKMGQRQVGTVAIVGPHDPGLDILAAEGDDVPSNKTLNATFSPLQSAMAKRSVLPLSNDRPGHLQVLAAFTDEKTNIREWFVSVVGGICYAGQFPYDNEVDGYDLRITDAGTGIKVRASDETTITFRYQDLINAIVVLVSETLANAKQVGAFMGVMAKISWFVRGGKGGIEVLGAVWIYHNQEPDSKVGDQSLPLMIDMS